MLVMARYMPLSVLLLIVSLALAQSQSIGCPARCLCFHRDNGMVVRCMFVGLTDVPKVPKDTSILDLRFNRISRFLPGIFEGLDQLYTLLLNSNEIEHIPDGSFKGLVNLKYLYLYKNKIESLGAGAFDGLNQLEQLFLHSNKLARVPQTVISPIKNLTRLRLDSNPLICDCDLYWLKNYTLHSENLMEVAATCTEPPNLNGFAVNEVPDADFQCKNGVPKSVPSQLLQSPKLTEEPKDVQVAPGEQAYLKCNAVGEPSPRITWYQNQQELITNDIESSSRFTILPDGSLIINDAQLDDQGYYACLALNQAGQIMSNNAMLFVQADQGVKPQFVQKPRDQTVQEGGSISLTCTTTNSAGINWYKDNQPYTLDSSRSQLLRTGTLLITSITRHDAGLYRCTASLGNEAVHATARVTVKETPYFLEEPKTVSVLLGGTAYFNCEASGFPKPTIAWFKNGRLIREESRFSISLNETNLRISDVKTSDGGSYECAASNAIATVTSKAQLIVRPRAPPTFTSQLNTNPINVDRNGDVELPCSAQGDPDPIVTWHRNDQPVEVTLDDKYLISPEGFLTIRNVTEEDVGSYECHAINSIGSAKLKLHIQLTGNKANVYPGDKFVQEAIAEASLEVNQEANNTLREISAKGKPLTPSDLLALFKFPSEGAQPIARSAEIFERTLELIIQKLNATHEIDMDHSDVYSNIKNLLSAQQIRLIADLSGCMESRKVIDCSDMCFHMKYRTLDGTCNNFHNPVLGSSLTKFNRWLPPVYENNFNLPIGWNTSRLYHGFRKPSARLVSIEIISAQEIVQDDRFTAMLMQWGQFLDHDLTLSPQSISKTRFEDGRRCNETCENKAPCFPMMAPPNDPRIKHRKCIGLPRSSAVCGTGMTSVFFSKITHREQINELTAFLDASNVYGSHLAEANNLRDLTDNRGLLKTGLLQTSSGKRLLPFASGNMDCQIDPNRNHIPCFLAGDKRANEQLGLLVMHTLWVREHNRIALELAKINKHWDGDMLYHETRKIVGAMMQHISYQHWLPLIVGPVGMSILGDYKGYDPSQDPSILNEFATAAFRFGHTLINPILYRFNSSMQEDVHGHLPLHQAFFTPFRVIEEGGIDPLLRGLFGHAGKLPQATNVLNSELTEKLFKLAHEVALDLAAMNIQRGRDHGLPGYNEWRKKCGMNEAFTFDDLANEIPDVKVRMKLEQVYGHPANIDLFPGATAEKILPGSRVGPTLMCILVEQFRRLRAGDRFFYESPGVFTPDQLAEIKQTSLAFVLCQSSDNITEVQADVFKIAQYPKQYIKCDSGRLPGLNLRVWADCCHDCTKAGNFRSITHSIASASRARRSTDHSFPDQKPSLGTPACAKYNVEEERLEGLEQTVELLGQQIRTMQQQIEILTSVKSSACLYEGSVKADGDTWETSVHSSCQCQTGVVSCKSEPTK